MALSPDWKRLFRRYFRERAPGVAGVDDAGAFDGVFADGAPAPGEIADVRFRFGARCAAQGVADRVPVEPAIYLDSRL